VKNACPHCQSSVGENWYVTYGVQKLEKGWAEAGPSVVRKLNVKRETLVMVYVCEKTNLPFLVSLEKAR
jgi:hypothetical protein